MTRRVLVTRLDGAGERAARGPGGPGGAAATKGRGHAACRARGRRGGPPAARRREGARLGQPVGREPRAAHRPRCARPVRRRPSPRGVDKAVILTSFHRSPLPTALLSRLAGVGRSPARRSTTPAPCSTCACGPATDPATTCPKTCPSPSGRWRSPPPRVPAAWRRPAARGAAAPAGRRPARAARDAARTSSCTPAPRCRPPLARRAPPSRGGPVRRRRTRRRRHRRARRAGAHRRSPPGHPAPSTSGGRTGLPELSACSPGPRRSSSATPAPRTSPPPSDTSGVAFAPVVPAVRWRPYRVRQVLLGDQDAPAATPAPVTARCPGTRA